MDIDLKKLDDGARAVVVMIWFAAIGITLVSGGSEQLGFAIVQALVWTLMFMVFYMLGRWIYKIKRNKG
ncbi:hypothetical protein Ga0123462_0489 [Mariprofundus ferrinatatus]|uniref:Uncharacterized protein n=1 Tax=Mariprofundus ferrinatatus TaxID=1921087 RepID=A0A2K8L8W1_9PROT|nr:hypothetical protein [Mariprofundus ferrinatatus]ATX81364.1 hypothetical protein Ga0123462_0489 [Mariprofundus ferrinatatus]